MSSRRSKMDSRGMFGQDRTGGDSLERIDSELFGELDRVGRPVVLNLDEIRIDGGTQPRAKLNQDVIGEYAESIQDGAIFPAIDVFYDGADYWLADGFHRWHAHDQAGKDTIRATIHQGDQRAAVLFSVGVNAEHGVRRTNDDKRRAVVTLLNDPEWAKWSDREIARQCRVSHPFVSKIRADLSGNDYQIGKKTGQKRRKVQRGDQTYTIKTKRAQSDAQSAPERPDPEPAGRLEDRSVESYRRELEQHDQHDRRLFESGQYDQLSPTVPEAARQVAGAEAAARRRAGEISARAHDVIDGLAGVDDATRLDQLDGLPDDDRQALIELLQYTRGLLRSELSYFNRLLDTLEGSDNGETN